jgi:Domain of unknown function (DUF4157)
MSGLRKMIMLQHQAKIAKPESKPDLSVKRQNKINGTSLPIKVQKRMGRAFNTDFSNVRIQVGQQAASLGALAYTQGNNIYFAPGQYNPYSRKGQKLLGHELAHVVQQRQGRVKATIQAKGFNINNNSYLEREAVELGKKAIKGVPILTGKIPTTIQNDEVVQLQIQHDTPAEVQKVINAQSGEKKTRTWVSHTQSMQENQYDQSGITIQSHKRAGAVEAIIHEADCEEVGKPTGNVNPLGWWWIGHAVPPKTTSKGRNLTHHRWVRFHLLNAKLGGDGHKRTHLVPTPNRANSSPEWQKVFEEGAKTEVLKNKKILHYYVEVSKWYQFSNDGTPPPLGAQYYPFFPKEIKAQYKIWDVSKQAWEKGDEVTLTHKEGLDPPPLTIGEQTIYYRSPSVSLLNAFGISDVRIINLLINAKVMLGNLNDKSTPQDLYNILYQQMWNNSTYPTLDKNYHIKTESEFDRIWDAVIEPSLISNPASSKKALIAPGWSQPTTITVKKKIEITEKMIEGKNRGLRDLTNSFDLNFADLFWKVIKEMVSGKRGSSDEIYKRIVENVSTLKSSVNYVLKYVDPKWEDLLSRIGNKGYYINGFSFEHQQITKLTDINNQLTTIQDELTNSFHDSRSSNGVSDEIKHLYDNAWPQMRIKETLQNSHVLVWGITNHGEYENTIHQLETRFKLILQSTQYRASYLKDLFSIYQKIFVPLETYKDRGLVLPQNEFEKIKNELIDIRNKISNSTFVAKLEAFIESIRECLGRFFQAEYEKYLKDHYRRVNSNIIINRMNQRKIFKDRLLLAIPYSSRNQIADISNISVNTDIIDNFISEGVIKAYLENYTEILCPESRVTEGQGQEKRKLEDIKSTSRISENRQRSVPQSRWSPTEERGREKRGLEDEKTPSKNGRPSKRQEHEPQGELSPAYKALKYEVFKFWNQRGTEIYEKDKTAAKQFNGKVKQLLVEISVSNDSFEAQVREAVEGITKLANAYLERSTEDNNVRSGKEGDRKPNNASTRTSSVGGEYGGFGRKSQPNHNLYNPSSSGEFGAGTSDEVYRSNPLPRDYNPHKATTSGSSISAGDKAPNHGESVSGSLLNPSRGKPNPTSPSPSRENTVRRGTYTDVRPMILEVKKPSPSNAGPSRSREHPNSTSTSTSRVTSNQRRTHNFGVRQMEMEEKKENGD